MSTFGAIGSGLVVPGHLGCDVFVDFTFGIAASWLPRALLVVALATSGVLLAIAGALTISTGLFWIRRMGEVRFLLRELTAATGAVRWERTQQKPPLSSPERA